MGKIYDALKRAEKEASLRNQEVKPREIQMQREFTVSEETPPNQVKKITSNRQEALKQEPQYEIPQRKSVKRSTSFTETKGKVVVLQQSHSIIAEQFRILRTRLSKFNKAGQVRTILVTSTLPGEGKSFVSSNLAVSIAQGCDEAALLIDTDLRKPSQDKIFNIKNDEGLSTILSKESDLENMVVNTDMPNLQILPSGKPPENPSELIASEKMKQFVKQTRTRYENYYIIFDSTPTLQTPEPAIMAEYVDGIIVVIRAGKTSRSLVQETIKTLGKEKILGVVFNYSHISSKSYNYYAYYSPKNKG